MIDGQGFVRRRRGAKGIILQNRQEEKKPVARQSQWKSWGWGSLEEDREHLIVDSLRWKKSHVQGKGPHPGQVAPTSALDQPCPRGPLKPFELQDEAGHNCGTQNSQHSQEFPESGITQQTSGLATGQDRPPPSSHTHSNCKHLAPKAEALRAIFAFWPESPWPGARLQGPLTHCRKAGKHVSPLPGTIRPTLRKPFSRTANTNPSPHEKL